MSEMHDLDVTEFLAAGRIEVQRVPVPELGGAVYLRGLTAYEFEEYEKVLSRQKDDVVNARARLLTMCLCDSTGKLLFSHHDIKRIGGLPAAVVLRLFLAARKLSKLDEDGIKELVGNSGSGHDAGFGSNSPTDTVAPSTNSNGVSPQPSLPS